MRRLSKLSPVHHEAEKWQGHFVEQEGWQVVQWFSSVEQEIAAARQRVALCDQSQRAKLTIEGEAAGALLEARDLAVNGGLKTVEGHLYRLRPDRFFISLDERNAAAAVRRLDDMAQAATSLITVTEVTHANAELWLIGPHSAELLGRLCSLDFYASQFPNGAAKQSSVAKITQLIIRQDRGGLPAYALIGPRSLASYLWQTIFEAGKDLGLQLMGNIAFEQLLAKT
jgi:heterotetrameric sarcosine oxidase gamma subunit